MKREGQTKDKQRNLFFKNIQDNSLPETQRNGMCDSVDSSLLILLVVTGRHQCVRYSQTTRSNLMIQCTH